MNNQLAGETHGTQLNHRGLLSAARPTVADIRKKKMPWIHKQAQRSTASGPGMANSRTGVER